MSLSRLFTLVLLGLVTLASLASASPAPPAGPPFAQAVAGACPACALLGIDRRDLGHGIAEYSFPVRVGGPHDLIRIHRVVKEAAPFVPVHAERALFMAHGDFWPFDAAFLNAVRSPAVDDSHALPIFLAARGVDVWGIDFRFTQLPAGTTDLSSLAHQGIEVEVQDLRLALAIARLTRALGGDGFDRLILLGWSRGGQIGYAALNDETQLPKALRQIKAFIPVDIFVKTDQPDLKAAACLRLGIT